MPEPSPSPAVAVKETATQTTHNIASPSSVAGNTPAPVRRRIWLWVGLALVIAIALAVWYFFSSLYLLMTTVSTDDAYVNGHVTFVAPRVMGQVSQVLVDDNMRVRAGDVLVRLDKEPYQVQVNLKKAAVGVAETQLIGAKAQVRGLLALARSQRYRLQTAVEHVDDQIALLKAKVAVLGSKQASLQRATSEVERGRRLLLKQSMSQEEFDQREEAVRVSEAQVQQAREDVYELRASLGLPPKPTEGTDLTQVPPDLDQTFSGVRAAVADLVQSLAQAGLPLASTNATPNGLIEDFKKRDASGDIDRILAAIVPDAPAVKLADATLRQTHVDLDQAELNLRYCDVKAEIDGVVTRRNVNPGNDVQAGQQLMAVRSVEEIWIDANFKETQLANLRIGQHVDLYTDAYGGKRLYRGRISGFTMGTGSTLALLPAQNATGNFVKVVQRLPIRIDLLDGNPEDAPLFVGLSVTPYVHTRDPGDGPNAGQKLQGYMQEKKAGENEK